MDPLDPNLSDFGLRHVTYGGITKPVLTTGDVGPAVVVIHEVYGFTRPTARFCRWVRDAGFRVLAPVLLGRADASNREAVSLGRMLGLCVSREINVFAGGRSSPIVDWLRPLARDAHAQCGGKGAGVIGMCLTGGFALAMAAEPSVLAPVMAQPGLPAGKSRAGQVDVSDADMALIRQRVERENYCVRGYRFEGDPTCPPERFARLARELGSGFKGEVLPQDAGNPAGLRGQGRAAHSVFTTDLIDAEGEPTKQAAEAVIAFFRERLL
jgi:dienelactone hydrolase